MKLGNYVKQPAEVEFYTINYKDDLTAGDNVQSATAVITPSGLTLNSIVIADPRVRVGVSGGAVGTKYKIEVTTVTADGRTLQDEFFVTIKNY